MKKQILTLAAAVAAFTQVALAGGYLTNTNHSVAFGREPSRDASIGIDGAYANPAGLLFLPQGLQIQFNYQNASQHRYIESTFAPFALGEKNDGATKKFEGSANAPFLPSLHVSYNLNEKWNVNGSFAVVGGGGKCEFDQGLASFESILPGSVTALHAGLKEKLMQVYKDEQIVNGALAQMGLPMTSYSLDSYMQGKQYYFGIQIGAGYKINDYLAVSLQGRLVIGQASYKGYLKDIKLNGMPASAVLSGISQAIAQSSPETSQTVGAYAKVAEGIELDTDQKGIGFIPIIGIDWHPNKHWNFAAKYEFNTKMRLKNSAHNSPNCVALSALDQFKDGNKVPEDMPALLTVGAMYSPIDAIRINAGYHCYFDQNAKKYNDTQKLLDGNTMEYSAGIEWDFCKNWTVSGGIQYAKYANTDDYMKDISFNTNAATYGFGFQYRINEHWDIDAAYFFSKYEKWTKESNNYNGTGIAGKDVFWRDNKVFGVGVTYKL